LDSWAYSIGSIVALKLLGPQGFLFYYPLHRALSFSIDLHQNNNNRTHPHISCKICDQSCEVFKLPHLNCLPTLPQYNLLNYYAYLFYPPLFNYGPMLGFHCWMRQINSRRFLQVYPWKKVLHYGFKLFLEYSFYILFTHIFYCETILIIPMNESLFINNFYHTFLLSIFQGLKLWFSHNFFIF